MRECTVARLCARKAIILSTVQYRQLRGTAADFGLCFFKTPAGPEYEYGCCVSYSQPLPTGPGNDLRSAIS